ncbi:hypothetical protein [Mesorhizobium sp. B2-8-9]|uniref:hypothetical protein n=1 Tax=Mesorhizobium sp. B2-8-9 TaxID=2589899 RepID=UPI001126D1B7|nr:hypothetical protein [Mesorhizobium sp. B2-8-9]TPI86431.1 hypothetical protein FJ423_00990 [Mesorhizobium sp. B2-8-9]
MSGTRERLYLDAARRAGLAVPDDWRSYHKDAFPHYHVFATMQRARKDAAKKTVFASARIVAKVSAEETKTLSLYHFMQLGFDLSSRE